MANNKDFKVKNGIQPTAYNEGLGTVVSETVVDGYNVATSTYDSVSTSNSIHGNDNDSSKFFFKDDGTKVFIIGNGSGKIWEYPLSTAYDVSTIGTSTANTSVTYYGANSRGGFFKPDGTRFYSSNLTDNEVGEYILSTAWDVSTMSPQTPIANYVISLSTNVASLDDVEFSSDGTVMVVTDIGGYPNNIKSYDLSTAWDITTATYNTATSAFATAASTNPAGIRFSPDGLELYIVGGSTNKVHIATLSTAYDISTITSVTARDSTSFDPTSQNADPYAVDFNSNGTKMYILGKSGNDNIYQYTSGTSTNTETLDLSTGSVFEVTPTSDIQVTLSNPADSGTVSQATLLLDGGAGTTYDIANASHDGNMNLGVELSNPNGMEISSDGTKIYAVGRTTDKVFEYVLSTPWDALTGTYNSVEFSVLSQTTYPTDIAFKPDGTKMYICTSTEDAVFQYSLSTAWDLSTASYDSVSFSTSSEENNVQALAFSNDGTKMYTAGLEYDNVVEYDLSTAWDVSTASHNSVTLSTSSQTTTPDGLFFNADGTSLFVASGELDQVLQYDMTTAFDLSTASYTNIASYDFAGQEPGVKGGRFDNTGTRMYLVGSGNDNVSQWTVGSTATITYDTAIEWPGGTAPTSPAIGETDVITFNTRDGGSTYQAVHAISGAK